MDSGFGSYHMGRDHSMEVAGYDSGDAHEYDSEDAHAYDSEDAHRDEYDSDSYTFFR
jgi:hypothetical protein